MDGDHDAFAELTDGPVYVRVHGDSTWVVCLDAELLLVTDDGEEAFQAGCAASRKGLGRPLVVQNGSSWRPSQALLGQIEQRRERIGAGALRQRS